MPCFGPLFSKRSKQKNVHIEPRLPTDEHEHDLSRSFEMFSVCMEAEIATFSGVDGWQTNVPLDVLHRSEELRNAFSDAEHTNEGNVTITLPTGILRGWLGSLHDLGVLPDDTGDSAGSKDPESLIERSTRFLKAADFLNDEDCLKKLVDRAVTFLFPSSSTNPEASMKGVGALLKLPKDLLAHILISCKEPLYRHLEVLPSELHMPALHAFCPSISTSATLNVDSIQSQTQFEALGNLLSRLTSLQSVTVSGSDILYRQAIADPIISQLQPLQKLQKLTLRDVVLEGKGAVALGKLFKRITLLQELSLNVECVSDQHALAYLGQLSLLKALKVLDLKGHDLNGLNGVRAAMLTPCLPYLTNLRKLCLASTNIHGAPSVFIAANLKFLTALEELDLSDNHIFLGYGSDEPLLPRMPFLRHLNMADNGSFRCLPAAAYTNLLCSMNHIRALQSLNISFSDLKVTEFICSIGSWSSLRTLILFSCDMRSLKDRRVLRSILCKNEEVQKLDVGSTLLFDGCTPEDDCLPSISRLQALTWLSLKGVGWSTESPAIGLAECLLNLQKLQKLHHLDLSDNEFTEGVAKSVVGAVCGFTSLRSLNISCTNLLTHAAGTFLQSNGLCRLERLDINSALGQTGCSEVLSYIGNISSLQSLVLTKETSDESEFTELLSCLSGLSRLSYLGLDCFDLDDEHMLRLASAVEKLGALRKLDFPGELSDVGWGALVQALWRWPEVVRLHAHSSFQDFAMNATRSWQHLDVVIY